jgi:hypothetical protein
MNMDTNDKTFLLSGSTHSGLSDVLDMISNIVSSEIQGSIYRARFSPNTVGRGGGLPPYLRICRHRVEVGILNLGIVC